MNATASHSRDGTCWRSTGRKGNWGPVNIAAMVGGFIVFPPLGLAVVAYNVFAEPGTATRWWHQARAKYEAHRGDWQKGDWQQGPARPAPGSFAPTGNSAFDDYRAETLARIEAERRRLEAEIDSFRAFQDDLRRARDREEFDRYMAQRAARDSTTP